MHCMLSQETQLMTLHGVSTMSSRFSCTVPCAVSVMNLLGILQQPDQAPMMSTANASSLHPGWCLWGEWCILHSPTDPQELLKDSSDSSRTPPSLLQHSSKVPIQSSDTPRTPQGVYQLDFRESSRSLQGLLRTWQISQAMKSQINLMP